MAFMKGDELQSEAARLGVNLEGMTWPEMQAAVTKAQAATGSSPPSPNKGNFKDPLKQYANKRVIISPMMAPTTHQPLKYDEDIGEEIDVEQIVTYPGMLKEQGKTRLDGTVIIKSKTGKRVIAQSTFPKINVEITFRPDVDVVPVARFGDREGYLWTHQRLDNIKAVLQKSGYFEEFLPRFQGNDRDVFYLGGSTLCCDIGLTHSVLKEIERKHAQRKRMQELD